MIAGFGELSTLEGEHEIAGYVAAHRDHLAALLLFELAHEGRAIPAMERITEVAGLTVQFDGWAARSSREEER